MPPIALVATLAVYAMLAVLLLSLNIFSLWRWWIKAAAILVTGCCLVLAYFTITAMMGWPSFTALPPRFNLVATRVVEPDRSTGAPGHVYLWVEEINENNVPVGAPRGYEVVYTVKLADDTHDAQTQINAGKQIMGQTGGSGTPTDGTQPGQSNQQQGSMGGKTGQGAVPTGQTAASETIGQGALVTFSEMPAVTLPDKSNVLIPAGG